MKSKLIFQAFALRARLNWFFCFKLGLEKCKGKQQRGVFD